MSETYNTLTASVTIRKEEEPYTRADGTQGTSRPGVTIKTGDGGYIRLGWIDAAQLAKILGDRQAVLSALAMGSLDDVANGLGYGADLPTDG